MKLVDLFSYDELAEISDNDFDLDLIDEHLEDKVLDYFSPADYALFRIYMLLKSEIKNN